MIYTPAQKKRKSFVRTLVYFCAKIYNQRKKKRYQASSSTTFASSISIPGQRALPSYRTRTVDTVVVQKYFKLCCWIFAIAVLLYLIYAVLPKRIVSPLPKAPPAQINFHTE